MSNGRNVPHHEYLGVLLRVVNYGMRSLVRYSSGIASKSTDRKKHGLGPGPAIIHSLKLQHKEGLGISACFSKRAPGAAYKAVLRCWKEGDVSVILVKDKIKVVLLGCFLFGKYFSKPCRSDVIGVESHIDALEILDEF
jgi:hypothetical protein